MFTSLYPDVDIPALSIYDYLFGTLTDEELTDIALIEPSSGTETTYRALRRKHTWQQVPITFHDRVAGRSKLSRRVVIEAMIVPWQLRVRQALGRAW